MSSNRRHHYVPVTYLKAWSGTDGKLRVFRKGEEMRTYCSVPERTGFEDYYYAFEDQQGNRNVHLLEEIFSKAETQWPELLARIRGQEDMRGHMNDFLELVALQRGRVPAARDMYELMQSDNLISIAKMMSKRGMLPPPPVGAEDILERLEIAVDPTSSLKAISLVLEGCQRVFDLLNYGVVRNTSPVKYLTSDNPVIWFDPSQREARMRPYNVTPDGPIELLFPLAADLVLFGWTPRKGENLVDGIRYGTTDDRGAIDRVNRMVARFGYDAVFATNIEQADLIKQFSDQSPVVKSSTMPAVKGQYMIGQMVFGKRRQKAKWLAGDGSGTAPVSSGRI